MIWYSNEYHLNEQNGPFPKAIEVKGPGRGIFNVFRIQEKNMIPHYSGIHGIIMDEVSFYFSNMITYSLKKIISNTSMFSNQLNATPDRGIPPQNPI